jgi:hypothetical protein
MPPSGMYRRVALVRADVSEEFTPDFFTLKMKAMFLRNVGSSKRHTASHLRMWHSS